PAFDRRSKLRNRSIDDPLDADPLGAQGLAAKPGEGEQVVDQVAHVLAAVLDPLQVTARLVRYGIGIVFEQDRGKAADRPQRCSQVVRDRVRKSLELAVCRLELLSPLGDFADLFL